VPEETKYVVETEYKVEDHASSAVNRIENAFRHTGESVKKLGEKFREFRQEQRFTAAAALGIGVGLGAWIEKAKEANAEFESTKKGVTGLLAAMLDWPKGIAPMERFTRASALAGETTEHLEETAGKYGQSLPEIAQGYKYLASAMAPLHMTTEQQLDLTDKIAATAKTTGTDVSMAFMQMGRAIMFHGVRPVGVLGATLKNALDGEGKLGKQGGAAGAARRLKLIEGVMKQQVPMADMMSQGIGDSLNRLRMEVDKVFRKLTGPVFKEIGTEIAGWSKKFGEMTKNGDLDRWSHTILDVFHQLQSVSGFLVDHWKTLAAIWATFKVGSMASGIAGGIGGLGGALGGSIGAVMGTFSKGLGGMAASMGPVIAGLGALYLAMDALIGWIDKKADVSRKIGEHGGSMMGATGILGALPAGNQWTEMQVKAAKGAVKELVESGALRDGKLDRGAMIANVGHMPTEFKEQLANQLGIRNKYLPVDQMGSEVFADALARKLMPILSGHPELLPGASDAKTSVQDDAKRKFTGKNVIFTGNNTFTMKFDDMDPDRVWVGMKRNVEQEAEHRTQSVYSPAWAE
jgi:hypothetical protein